MKGRLATFAVCSALAGLGFAREARADDESGVLSSRHVPNFESPQHFALEVRFSPYHPRVDDDEALGSSHPYSDTFGTSPRVEFALEVDWQALRIPHLGTIGPGLSAGYTAMSALARLQNPTMMTGPFSAENTSLQIFPFYAVLVLRVDVLSRELRIPLVPYVKAGLGMALWRAYNDGGTSSVATPTGNVEGKGHTFGPQVALGLALNLNVFDETAARNFDNVLGVNHTYLFAEAYVSQLTGLGQSNVLFVGNGSFTGGGAGPATPAYAFGLAFEF